MRRSLPNTCVAPSGDFVYGVHKSQFTACNLRENDDVAALGRTKDGTKIHNADNFPKTDVDVAPSTWVFEVPNAFPFMGATFIVKPCADNSTEKANPFRPQGEDNGKPVSTGEELDDIDEAVLERLPRTLLLALAGTSKDPQVLTTLAKRSCRFAFDEKTEVPSGMVYEKTKDGQWAPVVMDRHLFELVSNNPSLPDSYKEHMVLVPGAQGDSAIVGEYTLGDTHIWEYLRQNSYIPWGHFAANMAQDAIRYEIASLTQKDVLGLRHLYYQRIYVQLASKLAIALPAERRSLRGHELEDLRLALVREIEQRNKRGAPLPFNATIWGQNFGFDLSPAGYRLNASHQQVHQQFALVAPSVPVSAKGSNKSGEATIGTYAQGDLVAQFVRDYKERTDRDFFDAYLKAIQGNRRMDGKKDKNRDLIFFEDDNSIAFVPKAQRSQGEVQIMTKVACGNIVETDSKVRQSLDRAIWLALKVLADLGADMITALELSKRFDDLDSYQRLLYCFLPKHSQSPGGFSECQQRWITGHYPEDFAQICRCKAKEIVAQHVKPNQ
ncbi:MAG: hypothetical protein SWQ30_10205 [Thermodesulfobacteriota bacterium]|nr:hypothetical protein [Thermodesulfobacteriota bacterium]